MNDSYSLVQDTVFFVPVMNNDYDVDSATGLLSLTGNTNPIHGTLTPTATGYLYTPTLGYIGPDSFTYRIIDETALLSNIATVNLTINTSNTAPVVSNSSYSLNEETVFTGTLSGSDLEQSTLTYIVDTLPTSGTISLNGTGGFSYTPNLNYYGSDSFTFHANDGLVNSNIGTISLTVNSVNDIPVAYSSGYAIAGNSFASSGNIFSGTLIAIDIEDPVLTYTASTLPIHGILSLANSGTFTYTPAYGYTGSDSFAFHAIDSALAVSNTGTITLMITGINSAPIAFSGTYMTNEDTPINIFLSGSDPDGNIITYGQANAYGWPGFNNITSTGLVVYAPFLNFNGTVSFNFRTFDGYLYSAPQTITIDVLPVNDAPITMAAILTTTGNIIGNS